MKKIAIMLESTRAYARAVVEGVAAFAQERRDWILRPVNVQTFSPVRLRGFDGIIARILDDATAERLAKTGLPIVDVFCQKPRTGLASVESDHRAIGRMARAFFESRGFANFGYCGMPGIAFSDKRQDAFVDNDTHIFTPRQSMFRGKGDFYTDRIDRLPDRPALKKWLLSLPKPIGVFCCNDLRAIQLEQVALECGLNVPKDVAILGVDNDTMLCSFAEVPLSSIRPNSFKVGYDAARILTRYIPCRRGSSWSGCRPSSCPSIRHGSGKCSYTSRRTCAGRLARGRYSTSRNAPAHTSNRCSRTSLANPSKRM